LLEGYRIFDLTDEKGLLCGKILADLGADVIKVERPGGDFARNKGSFYRDVVHPEKSLFWFYTNLGKRGITLNIESQEGQKIFKELVSQADIVIESFKPSYMERLRLNYPELERVNHGIIVTSISPFGQEGAYSHYRCTDIVGMAMGGMLRHI